MLLIIAQVARNPTPITVATLTNTVHIPPTPIPQMSSISSSVTIHSTLAITRTIVPMLSVRSPIRDSAALSHFLSRRLSTIITTDAPIRSARVDMTVVRCRIGLDRATR